MCVICGKIQPDFHPIETETMRFSRKILYTLFAAALASVIVYAFLPKPIPVDLAQVVRGPMQVTVEDDGKTRIKERYTVSAPIPGRLLRIALDPGDKVEAGKTLIAVIEPTAPDLLDVRTTAEAEARVRAAEAAKEKAQHALKRAQAEQERALVHLKRLKQALERRAVSLQDVDDAEARERMASEEVRAEQSGIQVAEFELEQARAALLLLKSYARQGPSRTRFEVYSPISGTVFRVFQESEAVVPSNERLVELGDPGDLEVELDLLSTDAVKVKPGAKAYLDRWGGNGSLLGHVRLVEPSGFTKISALGVEEQRVNAIIDFTKPGEKWSRLGDAFRVDVRIVVAEAENVLKVPAGALFRQAGAWSVFVVQNGRAHLRPVEIGMHNDLEAEVLDGLDENAIVIAYPSDKIRDNVAVIPRKQ